METTTRKVVSRSPARTVHILNLPGLVKAPVEAESSLERDLVYKAALYPWLTDLRHQPFRLSLRGGKKYTPDFLAEFGSTPCVIEVKPQSKVSKYQDTLDEAREVLSVRGITFLLATERTLRTDRAHLRAADVLRYRKGAVSALQAQQALELIRSHTAGIPIGRLIQREGIQMEVVLHLMAHRQVTTGPNVQTADSALVFPIPNSQLHEEADHANQFARWLGCAPW